MNRLLSIFILILSCGYAFGQTTTNYQAWYKFNYKVSGDSVYAHSAFYAPVRDTNWTPTQIGAIVYKSTDQTLYVCKSLTGAKWTALGSGGGSTWGSITGTLSAQADLQAALNAKQATITTGTASQYLKGNLTLGTFSTDVQTVGDAYYSPLGHTHTSSQISDFTTAGRGLISAGSGITYNSTTGVISASGGGGGTYSFTAPLNESSGTVSITQANGSTNGYLSAVDWTLFNNKVSQDALDDTAAVLRALIASIGGSGSTWDTYNTHDTLTQSRGIWMQTYGLTFYSSDGTTANATGINNDGFTSTRGNSQLLQQSTWVYGRLQNSDASYNSRFQVFGLDDSTHAASLFSINAKNFNKKAALVSSSWHEGVKLQVNTAWKTSSSSSGYKGIYIEPGNGLGWAPLKIDREVLSVGTGTDSLYARNAATGETKLVAPGGGSSLPSQTGNAGKVLTTDGSSASWTDTRPTLTTLTDGATVTWDYSTDGTEAKVTLAGNRTLSITNLPSGKVVYLTLEVIQDATGSRTLTLPASTKVIDGGAGAVTLTTTGSATDIITFRWNGTTLFANLGPNYN
jgi:hypothetical protein